MRPPHWPPPHELSPAEQVIVARIKRAKLFVFLRRVRHELFDAAFQEELATIFRDSAEGRCPVPPAQLALVVILQAYTGASDDEALEALVMDRRWQLALDCLDCAAAPCGKGTLVRFRALLIAHDLDRRLVERTVETARQHGGFGPRQLRAALDSSPLWGAGRVEDTDNLLGHAVGKALGVIARQQGRGLADVAGEAGAAVVGGSSLKATLDLDWDDPTARDRALQLVLAALDAADAWLATQPGADDDPVVQAGLTAAQEVRAQDVDTGADGLPTLRHGVAADRRISVEDGAMRHGRKSRSRRIDGDKRHVLCDVATTLVPAVGVTPANAPEATVTAAIAADLRRQDVTLTERHLDRAYLSSTLVRDRPAGLAIYCKAWPVQAGDRFPKTAFALDWEAGTIRCPNGVTRPFAAGGTVQFPAAGCAACPLRERCTGSPQGRSVTIHPDERLLQELRERQHTPAGRAKLRERVAVEHTLAHVGYWQGARARYIGQRKNLFDLRRCGVVHHLHLIQRQRAESPTAAAA
jgi:hypothetical protein